MSQAVAAGGRGRDVLAQWLRLARRRVFEPQFWVIQAGVLAVTALHAAIEASGLMDRADLGGIVQLPVVLHLLPVAYAGFHYGYEGSILTGLWSGLLAIPNLLLWHSEHYTWLGDLTFIAFVIVLGAVIAIPVERERIERRRAERASQRATATSRRLAVLNDVSAMLVGTTASPDVLHNALRELVEGVPLRAACIVRANSDDLDRLAPEVAYPPGPETFADMLDELRRQWPPAGLTRLQTGGLVAPLTVGSGVAGALGLLPWGARDEDEQALLEATASQLSVAMENARLHQAEQERLRSYVREVTRAQERERGRIARDLHDVVAQDLVVLTRRLDAFEAGDAAAGDAVRELASSTLATIRQVSRDLRPTVVDDLGLAPALAWLVARLQERTDLDTRAHVEGTPRRLPPEVELALFRIAQEALSNVERHAEADRVMVRLRFDDRGVQLVVVDDGRGFEVPGGFESLARASKLGLLGMRERAELVGGTLGIESDPDRGTTVRVRVDVNSRSLSRDQVGGENGPSGDPRHAPGM